MQAFCRAPPTRTRTTAETAVSRRKTSSSTSSSRRSRKSELGKCRAGLAAQHGTFPKPQNAGGVRLFNVEEKPKIPIDPVANWIGDVNFLYETFEKCRSSREIAKICESNS